MKRAVFLDRDGTINDDVGDLCDVERLSIIPGALEALKLLQEYFLLIIVTNQSGIGKGIFNEREFARFCEQYNEILGKNGIHILKTYFCPHTRENGCKCRKPSPYFLKQAEIEYGIDLSGSFVVGDHPHDIEMAQKTGSHSVYLLTGHGRKHSCDLVTMPDFIAKDLYEAAQWIIVCFKITPNRAGKSFG